MSIFDKIKILYEDKDLLVIDKPAGLIVHPDGKPLKGNPPSQSSGKARKSEKTLVDWIVKKYPQTKKVGEPIIFEDGSEIAKPGIVHRLDRETSGVLVIVKNQKTFLNLKEQFKKHTVRKCYRAFLYGELSDERGVITRPIGRSNKDFRMWSAHSSARGTLRDAITEYRMLGFKNGFSFVEARPRTGRTHQIRVHFKALNHPVVADPLYAPQSEKRMLGFKRLALHSKSIEFNLPASATDGPTGKRITVEAPYPADFKSALKKLGMKEV